MYQDESWRMLPPNARKRSIGALHGGRNAGKRSTGAVLRAKIEFLKKYLVSTEGHSKLQKIAFGKISSIFSVLFLDDAFFHETGRRRGNLRYFWVRNSVPWPEIANRLARMGFAVFQVRNSILASLFAISGHGTELITKK